MTRRSPKLILVEDSEEESDTQNYCDSQKQIRKKREVVITDELKEFMDETGLRCQKCGVRTKNTNLRQDSIAGKSEGKTRDIIRAECAKCGSKKTQFGKILK